MKLPLTIEQMTLWLIKTGGKHRDSNDLRLGQMFCNEFGIQDQKLFYEEDLTEIHRILISKYTEDYDGEEEENEVRG
jgi:hypothetical protein